MKGRWITVSEWSDVCFRWERSRAGWRAGGAGPNLWGGCLGRDAHTCAHTHTHAFHFGNMISFTPTHALSRLIPPCILLYNCLISLMGGVNLNLLLHFSILRALFRAWICSLKMDCYALLCPQKDATSAIALAYALYSCTATPNFTTQIHQLSNICSPFALFVCIL